MKFEDIKTLTIVGSEVIINGVGNTIDLSLEDGIEAVQYHKGHRILEEPIMKEVEFEKYQEFIDEWQKVEDMKNIIPVPTADDLEKQRVSSIKSKAGQLIEEKYPTYKQLNIIRVGGVDLEIMSNYIDKVRSISNEAEKNGTKLEDIVWEIL